MRSAGTPGRRTQRNIGVGGPGRTASRLPPGNSGGRALPQRSATGRSQDVGEQLEIIRGEILRCRDITQQFLQLSRGQSVRREILEIPVVVNATLPLIAHVARDAGVAVRVVGSEAVPVVMANGGAVRQVLLNILLNAVQASRPGGEVRVGDPVEVLD